MVSGIWQEFLKLVHEEVGSRIVDTWFKAIVLQRWDAIQKEIYLTAPNTFVQEWVQKHYIHLFRLHLGRLLNMEMPTVIFVNTNIPMTFHGANKDGAVTEGIVLPIEVVPAKSALAKPAMRKTFGHINNSYSFKTFVVGPSNSLAYAAAYAVTEKLGTLYNPLFIYGGSGLGKTHLLHAIANEVQEHNKKSIIVYQTADRFVSEFIYAIRFDKVHKFQEKYHNIDVLLIDDVQFISNKEQTQEAFFHIFNALYESHKQIVFSSDTFPQNIKGIAERLRSRLSCGLVTDIYMPSLETKVAILKKKAAINAEILDDDVAYFIASHVVSNIRELEGALIRIMAFALLTKQPITLELTRSVLSSCVSAQESVDFDYIVKRVCTYFSYTIQDLRSKVRNKEIALARQIAMYLMKQLTNKSLREIGAFLGDRDHSTVMHGIEKVQHHMKQDSQLYSKVKQIEREIIELR